MNERSLLLRLFSRKLLDRDAASAALAFLLEYGSGILQPQECGVYEPFEAFDSSLLGRYVEWLIRPGGEFGFRRGGPPFAVEGRISNLLFPEMVVEAEDSPAQLLPAAPSPPFCSSWSVRFTSFPTTSSEVDFARKFFIDACRQADADYGFAADSEDFRAKHFISIRESNSEVQQYVGEDPATGVPGLYWLNFFGLSYIDFFGKDKLARSAALAEVAALPKGGFLLQFGRRPEDSIAESVLEQQREAIAALGEAAFFDIRRPGRNLSVPPALLRSP
jgi:hypothetical protein